jgi:thiamine kinase-like enzyme
VTITQIEGGAINTVHIVRCNGQSVILKQYGGNLFSPEDCENEAAKQIEVIEVLAAYIMSTRGWGPKLLGVFPGGRIEEYVDSHNLRPAEAADPNIRQNIAKRFAQIHSLTLPLEHRRLDFVMNHWKSFYVDPEKKMQMAQYVESVNHPDAGTVAEYIRGFDHGKELDYILNLLHAKQCKETIVILDCNFNNILVRNNDPEHDVMLIDYEGVMHGYRGIDIGSHFGNRMVQWLDRVTKESGFPYPDEADRRSFCESYRNQMIAQGQSLDPVIDSIDHIMMEAEIGGLFFFGFECCWLVKYCKNFLKDVSFMTGIRMVHENYALRKKAFTETYGE